MLTMSAAFDKKWAVPLALISVELLVLECCSIGALFDVIVSLLIMGHCGIVGQHELKHCLPSHPYLPLYDG